MYFVVFCIATFLTYIFFNIVYAIIVANGWTEEVIEELMVVSKYIHKDSNGNKEYFFCLVYNGQNVRIEVTHSTYFRFDVGDKIRIKMKLKYVKGLLKETHILDMV